MPSIIPQISDDFPATPGIYKIVNTINQHLDVGSAVNLRQRKRYHLRDLKAGKHHSGHLQRAYDYYGHDAFCFQILEMVEHVEHLLTREQYYIDTLNPEYNIARVAGNSLGVKRTPEYRAKMIATKTGKKHTPEARENMGAPKRGRKQSPEHIAKRSAALVGKRLSPEHAAKARVATLGMKHTPEAKAKMSEARLGKKQATEHVAKRTAARLANPENKRSPETVAKLTASARLANTGKKRSPEIRAKISAGKKAINLAKRLANQPPLFE